MKKTGHLRLLAAGWLSAMILMASEHHGQVTFGGLPVPGVAVTATNGDRKATAITDRMGIYSFPDLEDGTWSLRVEMSGFTTPKQDVGVRPGVPGVTFELKLKSLSEIHAQPQALARPSSEGPIANRPVPTVAGTARDFSAADAELELMRPRVTLNGTLRAPAVLRPSSAPLWSGSISPNADVMFYRLRRAPNSISRRPARCAAARLLSPSAKTRSRSNARPRSRPETHLTISTSCTIPNGSRLPKRRRGSLPLGPSILANLRR
jgi:hypothetical protein